MAIRANDVIDFLDFSCDFFKGEAGVGGIALIEDFFVFPKQYQLGGRASRVDS